MSAAWIATSGPLAGAAAPGAPAVAVFAAPPAAVLAAPPLLPQPASSISPNPNPTAAHAAGFETRIRKTPQTRPHRRPIPAQALPQPARGGEGRGVCGGALDRCVSVGLR